MSLLPKRSETKAISLLGVIVGVGEGVGVLVLSRAGIVGLVVTGVRTNVAGIGELGETVIKEGSGEDKGVIFARFSAEGDKMGVKTGEAIDSRTLVGD